MSDHSGKMPRGGRKQGAMSKTKTRPTPVARKDAREESKTPIWDAEFAARWEALQAAFAAADGRKG